MTYILLLVFQSPEPAGYAQGAIDLTTFKWYATYSAMKHEAGASVVYRHDETGAVSYSFAIDEMSFGEIIGPPWWDNSGAARWLLFTTSGGFLFRLNDTGSALVISTGYPMNLGILPTSPVLSDGTICYFGVNGFFMAWKGAFLWKTPVLGAPVGMPAWGDALYVATDAGRLYALDLASGVKLAQADLGGPALGAVSLTADRVAVGDLSGRLSAFETTALAPAFTYEAGAPIRGAVFMSWLDGRTTFGDDAGLVHVVDASGAPWGPGDRPPFPHAFSSSAIASAPLFESDLIYIGDEAGSALIAQFENDVDAPMATLNFPGPVRDFSWADPYNDGVGKILLMAGDGMHQINPIVAPPPAPYTPPSPPAAAAPHAAPAGGHASSSCAMSAQGSASTALWMALALTLAALRRP